MATWQWHSSALHGMARHWWFPWHHVNFKCFLAASALDSNFQLSFSKAGRCSILWPLFRNRSPCRHVLILSLSTEKTSETRIDSLSVWSVFDIVLDFYALYPTWCTVLYCSVHTSLYFLFSFSPWRRPLVTCRCVVYVIHSHALKLLQSPMLPDSPFLTSSFTPLTSHISAALIPFQLPPSPSLKGPCMRILVLIFCSYQSLSVRATSKTGRKSFSNFWRSLWCIFGFSAHALML